MSICGFCGHSDTTDEIRPFLASAIETHISKLGVTEFWVGCYGAFDRISKSEVLKAKLLHPNLKLYLLTPYLPTEKSKIDTEGVTQVIFPAELETAPKRHAIPRLNSYMVNHVDFLIAHVTHISGGAYKTMELAARQEKRGLLHITNI